MAERPGNNRPTVRLQLFWQYVLLGWFALVMVLQLAGSDWAAGMAKTGVALILAATVSIVGGLAWGFAREGKRGSVVLCGVLLVLLALAVTIRYIGI